MPQNPSAMYTAWGEYLFQLYNDPCIPILKSLQHSTALGNPVKNTFAEIWSIINPFFADALNGKAVGYTDFALTINRNGFKEECYFDFRTHP